MPSSPWCSRYLAFGLGAFPATGYLANHLFSIAVAPLKTMAQSAIDQVPNLVFLAVLAVVVRMGLRVLRVVFDAVERGAIRFSAFEPEWAQPTYKIVRFAIVAFAVVVAYPYMPGAQSAAFKGVSLFVGVLFSLGSSSAVANLIAGYMLIYRRAFKLGDRVQIGDVMGDVTESRIQVTRLRTVKNEEVVIPNSQILAAQVTNYSALAHTQGLILHTMVGIGYETPWRQVEAMLLIAAERTPGILCSPAPFVLQRALADFAVNYELNVYCEDAVRMLDVYTDLHRQILDVFNEYGVQIMTPAYRFDPAEPKIVPPSQWHLAPAAPPPPATATDAGADRHVAAAHFDRLRAEEWGLRRRAFIDRAYAAEMRGNSPGQRLAPWRRKGAGEGTPPSARPAALRRPYHVAFTSGR